MNFSKSKTKYEVKFTSAMKKDMKLALKRGYDLKLFAEVVEKLANGMELDEKFRDHSLGGNWTNHRECHLKPDWLLIYQIQNDILVLELT